MSGATSVESDLSDSEGGVSLGAALSFEVPGKPVPWARSGAQGKRRFTPAPQRAQMDLIGHAARQAGGSIPAGAPVILRLRFYYARPRAHFNVRGEVFPRFRGILKTSRPDLDNLVKLVKDALSGICYTDDAQVIGIEASKGYGTRAGTSIEIKAIEPL